MMIFGNNLKSKTLLDRMIPRLIEFFVLKIFDLKFDLIIYSYEIFCYNTGNDKLREEALWILKL